MTTPQNWRLNTNHDRGGIVSDDDDNVIDLRPMTGKDGSRRTPGPGRGRKGVKIGKGPASGLPATGQFHGAGNGHPAGPGPGRMPDGPEREKRIADKQAAAEEALATLREIGQNEAEMGGVRVMALNAVLDRIEGKPVQRSVSGTLDDFDRMTDGELVAELTRATKILTAGREGVDPPPLPRKSTDVVQ